MVHLCVSPPNVFEWPLSFEHSWSSFMITINLWWWVSLLYLAYIQTTSYLLNGSFQHHKRNNVSSFVSICEDSYIWVFTIKNLHLQRLADNLGESGLSFPYVDTRSIWFMRWYIRVCLFWFFFQLTYVKVSVGCLSQSLSLCWGCCMILEIIVVLFVCFWMKLVSLFKEKTTLLTWLIQEQTGSHLVISRHNAYGKLETSAERKLPFTELSQAVS